ncbi:hypothetical protein AB0M46_02675 [Dactylosporangium sp. NPDC051485]|uniref:hypothetical protein n=1 Tax=Dactylosporangium sp. NPDC051485 TaxID=3154846 RepID=UPI00343589FC
MTAPHQSPYQGAPYTTPPYPPPGPARNRRKVLGLVLGLVGGMFALCLILGTVLVLAGRNGDRPGATDPATQAATRAANPAAGGYKQPTDPCALADPSLLGPRVGTGAGEPVEEKTRFTLNGCEYFLAAADGAQGLKAFANVDGDTAARYNESAEVYPKISGFDDEKVTGCGSLGFYTRRLSAGDKRIEAILVCVDQNLYVEVRFTAGGTEPWDSDAMKTNMAALVNGMMTKVPKA